MSSSELEEAIERLRRLWQTKTNNALTIRDRCTNCWRGENEHLGRDAMGQVCTLKKLTPSVYFDQLKSDREEAERVAVLYSKSVADDDVIDQMEKHINQLASENQELKEARDQRPRRRHEGDDATEWETTGDEGDEGDEESVGEHPPGASSSPAGEWENFDRGRTPL